MLFAHLLSRIGGLLLLGVLPLACLLSYRVGQAHLAARRCVAAPSPVVLHVSARDVAYARAQGWPRELSRASPLGFAPGYDGSATGRRVVRLSRRFCAERRFRLVAR